MKSIDHSFYRSKDWEKCRASYLSTVGYFCERCKQRGIYNPAVIVHHKTYLTKENYKDPRISLNFDNLEALCKDCHNKEHFGDKEERRYEIGKDGELIF